MDQNFGAQEPPVLPLWLSDFAARTSPFTNIAFPAKEPTAAETSSPLPIPTRSATRRPFTPNLVGEFRFGYTRSVIKLTPLSVGFDITSLGLPAYLKTASADAIFPRFNITDMTAIGPERASHDVDAENTPEVQAHFTWLKGAHAIKTGYDMLFCQFNTFRPDYPSGTFSFGRAYTQGPNPVDSVRHGRLRLGQRPARRRRTAARSPSDRRWRCCRPVLQLVPAGRLEGIARHSPSTWVCASNTRRRSRNATTISRTSIPSATEPVTGLKGVLLPTTSDHRYPSDPNNNWAPRVGLAWTFLPNTVFRAGYGLFYAPGSGGIGSSPGDLGSGSSVSTGIYFGRRRPRRTRRFPEHR